MLGGEDCIENPFVLNAAIQTVFISLIFESAQADDIIVVKMICLF